MCIMHLSTTELNCDWEQGYEGVLEKAATDAMAV
jgi:hypothetical protein